MVFVSAALTLILQPQSNGNCGKKHNLEF